MSDATITLKCNNNCVFCPRYLLENIMIGEGLDKILSGISKIRSESDVITLSGGEVSILPEFWKILNHCRRLKFKRVSMITNGRMFSDIGFVNRARKFGLVDVGVSVYSTNEAVHDKITRTQGSFKQTLAGLKNAISCLSHVWVNITVSKYNQDTLAKTIKDLESIGVKEFLVISVITEDEDMKCNLENVTKQIKKVDSKAKITFKGFPRIFIPHEFPVEPHEFNTFVSLNDKSGQYMKKVTKLMTNTPKELKEQTNYYAFMAMKLLSDDLYPPPTLGGKIYEKDIMEGWADTSKGISEGRYPDKLGIYAHIPFCVTKCKFCFCGSIQLPKNRKELDTYLDFLEIQIKKFSFYVKKFKVTSLYVGGGTPSIFTPVQLKRFFGLLYDNYDFQNNVAVIFEATPLTLSEQKCKILHDIGKVSRLTIGVQSMNPKILKDVDRTQTDEMVKNAIIAAKNADIPFINVDYIVNLPGQTLDMIKEDLEKLADFKPHSVHLNNYKPLVHTRFVDEDGLDVGAEDKNYMLQFGEQVLISAGYRPLDGSFTLNGVEPMDNAQELDLRRQNSSLIGLGYLAMSHSYGNYQYEYLPSMVDSRERIKNFKDDEFSYFGVGCNEDEEMRKYAINNLRSGIDIGFFKQQFGIDPLIYFKNEIDYFRRLGKFRKNESLLLFHVTSQKEFEIFGKVFFSKNLRKAFSMKYKDYDNNKDYMEELNTFLLDCD